MLDNQTLKSVTIPLRRPRDELFPLRFFQRAAYLPPRRVARSISRFCSRF